MEKKQKAQVYEVFRELKPYLYMKGKDNRPWEAYRISDDSVPIRCWLEVTAQELVKLMGGSKRWAYRKRVLGRMGKSDAAKKIEVPQRVFKPR